MNNQFSHSITTFQGKSLPEAGFLVGYAALIHAYDLQVPMPGQLCAIGEHHRKIEKDGWRFFTPRHAPEENLEGQLTFALKYEGVDLGVLYRLFMYLGSEEIARIILQKPTGI
jgi:hypothetical protein